MIYASIALFTLGAIAGLVMLFYMFKKHHIPKAITFIHGLFVISGLLLLLIYNFYVNERTNWISVSFFIVAAILGLYVLEKDIRHLKVKWAAVISHAGLALIGFGYLVFFAFSK